MATDRDRPFTAVVVFTRFPRRGRVKTRLAQTIGDDAALSFHRKCAEHTFGEIKKFKRRPCRYYLFVARKNDLAAAAQWAGEDFFCRAQAGGDLGKRMQEALRTVISHGAAKVIILGTDVPDISVGLLEQAHRALDDHDLAIGPSGDGGYYLLGVKRMHTELFEDMTWSTAQVYAQTLRRAEQQGLHVHRLAELCDIDTQEDLERWFANAGCDMRQRFADVVPERKRKAVR